MAKVFTLSDVVLKRLRHWWDSQSQQHKLLLLVGTAAALSLAVGGWIMSQQTVYTVVYSGLSPRVGGSVIAALQKENIPFRLRDQGSLIEVPKADAARVRLQLAEQGLPIQASSALWKQLQDEKLGTSSFVEHATYLRALEFGLAHDIMSIHGITAASVNLAIPRHTPFLERMPVPKAAVTVRLMPGITLSPEQVFGITHLVASSVPGLHARQVTVVDQNGQALTAKVAGAASSTVLHLQRSVERVYQKQIIEMLAPLVGGTQNLRVVVDANIDLAHHQESSITYGMGHVVKAAILSSADKGSISSAAFGIPGALSNQPPGAPQAPITAGVTSSAPALSLPEMKALMPRSSKKQQHFRYVLDKTVGFRKGAPWRLRTLSVSVLVNGQEIHPVNRPLVSAATVSAEKKKRIAHQVGTHKIAASSGASPIPDFTAQTMKALRQMVANAIHASAPQGTIDVTAMPFRSVPPPPPLSWWQRVSLWAVWHQIEWFLLGLIALILLRKPIKDLIMARKNAVHAAPESVAQGGQSKGPFEMSSGAPEPVAATERGLSGAVSDISDDGTMLNLAGVSEGRLEDNMNIIKNLIRSDTIRAVEVVREWLGNPVEGEGSG